MNENKQSNEPKQIDVAALMSRLNRGKITSEAFRWAGLTEEQAAQLLWKAFQVEVSNRKRTFVVSQQQKEVIRQIAYYMTSNSTSQYFGVMLNGRCGNGKTTLVKAVQAVTNLFQPPYSDKGITIANATDIAMMLKSRDKDPRYDIMRKRQVLAIEDLGTEPAQMMEYGNALSPMVDVLEYRYRFMLPTFVTTNLTPKEIAERYGERIASRCKEMFYIVTFFDEYYR